MPTTRLRRYGATLTRFFGTPGGVPYVVRSTGETKVVQGSFDPVHEREQMGGDGYVVILRKPCLTVHPDLLDFSPAEGDTFEADGFTWVIDTTEEAGMGSIRLWCQQRISQTGGWLGNLPFPTTP